MLVNDSVGIERDGQVALLRRSTRCGTIRVRDWRCDHANVHIVEQALLLLTTGNTMWGNTLGWIISLAIVLATVGGLVLFQQHLANLTPVTELGRDPAMLAPLKLPVEPAALLPPRDTCDAGPIYRRAIELVREDLEAYERFAAEGTRSDQAQSLAALELLVSATECAQMNLFTRAPDEVVRYGPKPELRAIHLAGKCANKLGALLHYEKRPEEALKHCRAAFALGARLYQERLVLEELLAGLELLSAASGGIAAASSDVGDAAQAEAFAAFRAQAQQYYASHIAPLQRVIGSIDPGVIERHTGDVFHIARHAQERMWRVEAILTLGRLRFHAARVADQQGANHVLQRLSEDPDPVIRAAANAARNLTIEQYRMLG